VVQPYHFWCRRFNRTAATEVAIGESLVFWCEEELKVEQWKGVGWDPRNDGIARDVVNAVCSAEAGDDRQIDAACSIVAGTVERDAIGWSSIKLDLLPGAKTTWAPHIGITAVGAQVAANVAEELAHIHAGHERSDPRVERVGVLKPFFDHRCQQFDVVDVAGGKIISADSPRYRN